jgi:uncharacterized protein (TIGR00251 family)
LVTVSPKSSRNDVRTLVDGSILVRVTAPPVESAANHAVVKMLAEALGIPTSSFEIVHGARSRQKLIQVDVSANEIARRMKSVRRSDDGSTT